MQAEKVIIDANVIYLARIPVSGFTDDALPLARKCIEFLKAVMNDNKKIVMDLGQLIYKEYRDAYEEVKNGDRNVGSIFCRWFFQYYQRISNEDYVELTPNADREFEEFPDDTRLANFDRKDRKYIAVANKHTAHPPVIEGADVKWLGYRDVLEQYCIRLIFLDEDYAVKKYKETMG